MAIQIDNKINNGVVLNYHRIAAINIELNQQITVIVESYIDEAGRQYEKNYAKGLIVGEPTFPYTNMEYLHIPWSDTDGLLVGDLMQNAYDWLKTQPQYMGSKDI